MLIKFIVVFSFSFLLHKSQASFASSLRTGKLLRAEACSFEFLPCRPYVLDQASLCIASAILGGASAKV